MRKKVLALIMGALAISTIGAFAQTQNQATGTQQTECCKEKKDCKEGRKFGKKAQKGAMKAFEGINLTPEQQQQIEALRDQNKAEREATKKATRETVQKQKDEYVKGLEKILTPEQFTQYKANLENLKVSKKKDVKRKAHKDGDFKMKEARPDVQPREKR